MSTDLLFMTCDDLAASLLPSDTANEHAIVSGILQTIARRHAGRSALAPVINRDTLLKEVQALRLGDGKRAFVVRGLENAVLNCTWSPKTFDAETPGFRVVMLTFLNRTA